MKIGDHIVGLFQGMIENDILTFNPGWDQNGQPNKKFTDIREIQEEIEPGTEGPASFMIVDPDGNPVLFDQHL